MSDHDDRRSVGGGGDKTLPAQLCSGEEPKSRPFEAFGKVVESPILHEDALSGKQNSLQFDPLNMNRRIVINSGGALGFRSSSTLSSALSNREAPGSLGRGQHHLRSAVLFENT